MNTTKNLSFAFMGLMILILGKTNLIGAFLLILFSYLALSFLQYKERKWVGVACFFILVTLIVYGFGFAVNKAIIVIPNVVEQAIPKIVEYAQKQSIELPFKDPESLKSVVVESVKSQLSALANIAKIATKQFIFLIIALVMVINLYLRNSFSKIQTTKSESSLLDRFRIHSSHRFSTFYDSFRIVMGAQVLISLINTTLTSIFILATGTPYPIVIIFFTFLCGLVPVIGNLISNTLIVGISLTVSINLTLLALVFLIVIHKLEYFLNSKIIGDRIKTPMWLTLLGLALGEKLLGIPGMVLAPVLLNYVKMELASLPKDYFYRHTEKESQDPRTNQEDLPTGEPE